MPLRTFQKYIWIFLLNFLCVLKLSASLSCRSRTYTAQHPFNETSALAVNLTSCEELWQFFPFSIPTQKSCWFGFSFLLQNSGPSTFKLLSKIHTDTISHPEVYLDLGNEFCLACPQILAIHIRLTGYLLCGKYSIILPTQVIHLAKEVEGKGKKPKWFKQSAFTATAPQQLIPTTKK